MIVNENLSLRLWTILAILVGWQYAHAQKRVYLHDVQAKGENPSVLLSKRFETAAVKKLSASPKIVLVEQESIPTNGEAKPTASRLLKALVAGKQAYTEKRYADAVDILKNGLQDYQSAPGDLDSLDDYAEVLAYLGAVYLKLQYGGDAKDTFRRLVTIRPDYKLDRSFHKKVRKKFKKIRKKWRKKKPGKLKVTGLPKDQVILINGQPADKIEKDGVYAVARGEHQVRCSEDSGAPVAWVRVKSGETVQHDCQATVNTDPKQPNVDESLKRFVKGLRTSPNDLTTVAVGREICDQLKADFLAVPFLRTDGEKLEVIGVMFSKTSGLNVQIGTFGFGRDVGSVAAQGEIFALSVEGSTVSFPFENALVPNFLAKPASRVTRTQLSPRQLSKAPKGRAKAETKPTWYKSWAFWTTAAVVVGGASAAGYFLYAEDDSADNFALEATW